jgi:hypothetical protein
MPDLPSRGQDRRNEGLLLGWPLMRMPMPQPLGIVPFFPCVCIDVLPKSQLFPRLGLRSRMLDSETGPLSEQGRVRRVRESLPTRKLKHRRTACRPWRVVVTLMTLRVGAAPDRWCSGGCDPSAQGPERWRVWLPPGRDAAGAAPQSPPPRPPAADQPHAAADVSSTARPRWPGDRGHPARPSATVFGKDSRHGVGWNRRQILLAHPEGSNFEPARLTIPTSIGIMLTVRKVK